MGKKGKAHKSDRNMHIIHLVIEYETEQNEPYCHYYSRYKRYDFQSTDQSVDL